MKIMINGYAQHGKDTVGEMFSDVLALPRYNVSHDIAKAIMEESEVLGPYQTWEEAYTDRVNHRKEWYEFIRYKREKDPLWLIDTTIEKTGMYIGHRNIKEFNATIPLVDAAIWVDASGRGLPKEDASSCELTPHNHDYVIDNGQSLVHTLCQVEAVVDLINNRKKALNAYT